MDISKQILSRREEMRSIAARHGARSARIFGSVARGEPGPESDLDLLVELEPGRTLLDQAALQLELEELLQRKVDVVTVRGLRAPIREHVLRESVPL